MGFFSLQRTKSSSNNNNHSNSNHSRKRSISIKSLVNLPTLNPIPIPIPSRIPPPLDQLDLDRDSQEILSSPQKSHSPFHLIPIKSTSNPLLILSSKLRRKPSTSSNPPPSSSDSFLSHSSFHLNSFRNVRSGPQPPSTPPPPPPPPILNQPSRPSSPSTRPSPKISAAAFREARAARTSSRTSLSSAYSDHSFHLDLSSPHQPHQQLYSPSTRALSEYRLAHTPLLDPLPNKITTPHQPPFSSLASSSIPSGSTTDESDLLVPPRPAFYGSRSSPRPSSSSSPSFSFRQSSAPPHSLHQYSKSHVSVRSMPISQPTPSSASSPRSPSLSITSTSPNSIKPALLNHKITTQLDKWHSDDDDDDDHPSFNPPPKLDASPTSTPLSSLPTTTPSSDDDDDDDDSLPLSQLKLVKTSTAPSSRRTSVTSASSKYKIPPLPSNNTMPLLSVATQQLAQRGNSPCSSSSGSGGSASGWTLPVTPRDSHGTVDSLLVATSVASGSTPAFHDNHNHHHNNIGALAVPPTGVDPFLYAKLGIEQKIQLHHRSQMMLQMMAAQAQMHAIALSKTSSNVNDSGLLSSPTYQQQRSHYQYSGSTLGIPTSTSTRPLDSSSTPSPGRRQAPKSVIGVPSSRFDSSCTRTPRTRRAANSSTLGLPSTTTTTTRSSRYIPPSWAPPPPAVSSSASASTSTGSSSPRLPPAPAARKGGLGSAPSAAAPSSPSSSSQAK